MAFERSYEIGRRMERGVATYMKEEELKKLIDEAIEMLEEDIDFLGCRFCWLPELCLGENRAKRFHQWHKNWRKK